MAPEPVLRIELASAEATEALGAALAAALAERSGAVIFLEGPIGAGKTTLARGLLRALGVTERVRSPTYTLVESYALASRPVLHLDLYRLADPAELDQLGLDDQPPDASLWLVEWPEFGAGRLPAPDLRIGLGHSSVGRLAEIWADPGVLNGLRAAGVGPELAPDPDST